MNLYALLRKRAAEKKPVRVGLIGAGKFGAMFLSQARLTEGLQVVCIADLEVGRARDALLRTGWPNGSITEAGTSGKINDAAAGGRVGLTEDALELIAAGVDVVIECTGIPEVGIRHALASIEAGRDIVMVNVEADALAGPLLSERASRSGVVYSMAYGDQPALVCEMVDWARTCGFEVVAAGKGTKYLPEYHYSTPDTVWGYYGFTPEQVAQGDFNPKMFNSFLDGTKSAIEMTAISNATGLVPQPEGLGFPPVERDNLAEVLKPRQDGGVLSHSGTVEVVSCLNRDGSPVQNDLRWGVYVTFKASTPYVEQCFQQYSVTTDSSGRYAALYRTHHLIGLELGVSVASVALRREPTGSARQFIGDVGTVAKRDLAGGEILDGEGGYTVFGRLLTAKESLSRGVLPLGLASGAKVVRPVAKDEWVAYDDIEIDSNSVAVKTRKEMEDKWRAGVR
jgi:predicted homoserine dehydrogenase-like protein